MKSGWKAAAVDLLSNSANHRQRTFDISTLPAFRVINEPRCRSMYKSLAVLITIISIYYIFYWLKIINLTGTILQKQGYVLFTCLHRHYYESWDQSHPNQMQILYTRWL